MVTVQRAIYIIKAIRVLQFINKQTSINQISMLVNSCSRSTIYRAIPRLEQLGLIESKFINTLEGNSVTHYYVTKKGLAFLDSALELNL